MAVRMTHPRHGVTHAVGAEVEWNKSNGWVVEPEPASKPIATAPVAPEPEPPAPEEQASLAEQYAEKFGKPPHHRMKAETIRAALED